MEQVLGSPSPNLLEGASERDDYIRSLELIRALDVLVPWAATSGQSPHAVTDRADAERRIDAILDRVRLGENH